LKLALASIVATQSLSIEDTYIIAVILCEDLQADSFLFLRADTGIHGSNCPFTRRLLYLVVWLFLAKHATLVLGLELAGRRTLSFYFRAWRHGIVDMLANLTLVYLSCLIGYSRSNCWRQLWFVVPEYLRMVMNHILFIFCWKHSIIGHRMVIRLHWWAFAPGANPFPKKRLL